METAPTACKTLFLVFSEVLKFSEGLSNTIDPTILFKCAKIVEDMYIKTVSLGAVKEFESKLHEFWTLEGVEPLPLQYFENSLHLILSRFICDNKYSDDEVKLAIEEFISYKSEKEFFEVVKKLNQTHHLVRSLMTSIDINIQPSDFRAVCLVEQLKELLVKKKGSTDTVYSAINKIVSDDKEGFMVLLKVLCLHNDNELSLHVQELVSLFVSNSLKECKKAYTYTCFIRLRNEEFNQLIVRWDFLTDSLIDVIEFSIRRLKCEYSGNSYSWTNNPGEEKCMPFNEIVALINKLKAVQEKYNFLKEVLHRWKNENLSLIAEDLIRICKIK